METDGVTTFVFSLNMVYKFIFFKGGGGGGGGGGNNTIIQKKTISLLVCGAQFGRRHVL